MGNPSRHVGILFLAFAFAWGAGQSSAATVFGTVAEPPQYIPIQGAIVRLVHGPTKQVDSLQTDSAGAYHFYDVTGCEQACAIEVGKPGFWFFASDYFGIAADGGKQVDVALERIHSLTVRVFKAEDTAQAILNSQAVLFSAGNEPPRSVMIDSTGSIRFTELQSFTGYLLSVSAPGRKTTSNMLHFHDPVSNIFFRVLLDSDVAATNKELKGALSMRGAGPAVGERVLLSCRNDQAAADLFAQTGSQGEYSIPGVPAACDSVRLYAGEDSTIVAMPDKENQFDWSAVFPGTLAVRPGGYRKAQAGSRPAPWRGYDLVGRKLAAFIFGPGPMRP
ncbi:MAG: carboxypeptidase regulatory-like domain-containing protein [Fibrobacteres bacterium]|jgi:hypothetical protein|nr:carboxypeptidase regulatory-like domain-containing protein [Fibrobacterota bacterium]